MNLELPDWEPKAYVMFLAGAVTAVYLCGIVFLAFFSIGLSTSTQAMVFATALGSVGTLLLALATFYNIFQTNRTLELREKKMEKPKAVDELSYLIQPAINKLRETLSTYEEADYPGCSFDWVYASTPYSYTGMQQPARIGMGETLASPRLTQDNPTLYAQLRYHDDKLEEVSEMADQFHKQLLPKVQELLDGEGIEQINQSMEVVTLSVLQELDHFGESHELFEFWEKHGEELIRYGREETEVTISDIKSAEEDYTKLVVNLIEILEARKAELKERYSISEDEITARLDDDQVFSVEI